MGERVHLADGERYTFGRLPALMERLGIKPTGVIHVGAHIGEEVPVYEQCGFARIVLVEPDVARVDYIRQQYPTVEVVHAACADVEGVGQLWRGERTYHDSLIEPPAGQRGPTVRTARLDALQRDCNVIVIDTQGTEYDVLVTADLAPADLLIVETVQAQYRVAAADRDLTVAYLAGHGWEVVEEWQHDATGHTDSVFARAVPRG